MHGSIGVSVPSLHRESTDSLTIPCHAMDNFFRVHYIPPYCNSCLHMTIDPVLDASSPLTQLTRELFYEFASLSAGIEVELRDDVIALEPPQLMSLGIVLSSSECYDLAITPTTSLYWMMMVHVHV